MVFKCQEDSFLKKYISPVKSCAKAELNNIQGFNVILEDTILFPEGGGQPCDYGFLAGFPVLSVKRVGAEAVHFVNASVPFQIGEKVEQILDWDRRHDNMQQHSGQHLITAIFEQDFGLNTKAWWLGNETSNIELDGSNVTQDQLDFVEKKVNDLIAQSLKVTVKVFDSQDPELPSSIVRANRELPKDHVGPVRTITIHTIDSCMCCGTHVTNLSQLQCIKLLNAEKTKNKLLVHFLVGNRVIKKLENCYNREQQLNLLLNGGPTSHIELLKKLQLNLKVVQKSLQKCVKEIAYVEALKLMQINPIPKYYFLHRTDGNELDFINVFLKSIAIESIFLFLTVGDETGKGQMVLHGNENDVAHLGPIFCNILEGKGNGKKQRFQAKINNLKKIIDCEKLAIDYFTDKS